MFFVLSVAYISFPERPDSLLTNKNLNNAVIEASGSLGIFYSDSKCTPSYPNQTTQADPGHDWCSNIGTTDDMPWISYSFPSKSMRLKGYSVRNGCCRYYDCCCIPETGERIDYYCCCRLYSFRLQGSNDKKTWKTIHKVEKDISFHICQIKTYEFPMTESFNYVRIYLDEPKPGCPNCMQINQVELYGELSNTDNHFDNDDTDESISIIGKVKKN